MTYEEYNDFCSSLIATSHVVQWGGSDVWKVGKEVDGKFQGKMFFVGGLGNSQNGEPAITFKVSDLEYEILKEQKGFRPAPYLASRGMKWIQCYEVAEQPSDDLIFYIKESYRIVSLGLTKKLQKELGLNQS